jgi:putative membrane-bound dehydrogenase-like protein
MIRPNKIKLILPLAVIWFPCSSVCLCAADANRLTYLDEFCDSYVVGLESAKLSTPQWIGEGGVEAVATLGIDDMADVSQYENYLRPLLNRLKQIDGRAPVSIMTIKVDPQHPQLQAWLKEGVSLETHTADHPCPCLKGSGFEAAKSTYDRCVDQMAEIPGSRPVAFRFPCCDSRNTPSPRAFAEILAKTTSAGNFLQISTSVCAVLNEADPLLPSALVRDAQNRPRYSRYVPFPNFVNKVFNYPYPFVISGSIWEFPIGVPDDWQGQNLQKPFNPQTLEDMQAYLDAVVLKRGVANFVFHPHGWIRSDQMVALVDHAVKTHGGKVKFLTFKECLERLNKHLLAGQSLRADDGGDNGVRILDVNDDGYMDVLIGNDTMQRTRLWNPNENRWIDGHLPVKFVTGEGRARRASQVRFGVIDASGLPVMIVRNETSNGAWRFEGQRWVSDERILAGLEVDAKPIATGADGRDLGVRLRDLDSDGVCELLIANPQTTAVFRWDRDQSRWQQLSFKLPKGVWIVNADGRDGGTRFADFDADSLVDVIDSCERGTGLFLFDSMTTGWKRKVFTAAPGDKRGLPMFANNGVNGGGWIADRQVWFQSEETAKLPDGVFHRSFNEMLANTEPRPLAPEAALKSMHVSPGYRVELAAAEPLVMDPVAFDWGPDGKLWVAEMADYPLGIDGKGTPGGRVRFLEDTDDDGKYDRSTLFLDGLKFPNGVMAWRDGVLVTAAPEVFFARDTDGDGKSDERTVLFEGFPEANQQHRANGLRWNIDGWVHLANGDQGGEIRSVKTGHKVDLSRRDLRIKPDEGLLETVTGFTQFGRNRDDAGHWFGTSNPKPLYQFVLDDHYLRRNPHIAPPAPAVHVVDRSLPLYPLSRTLARFINDSGANAFTSACSGMIYRDDLLPNMAGDAIVCEPVHNLVHREVLSREGLLFTAKRAIGEEESHLLRSTDNWFRPVMARTGPDGAIWIADMYRQVIEHPEWIPDDQEARLDLRAGHDKGRIYRIIPLKRTLPSARNLETLDTINLVSELDSSNGTQRDRVQQLLLWRADQKAVEPLRLLATESRRPTVRAQVLWTLAALNTVDEETIAGAFVDVDPIVRVEAIRLAEPRLNESSRLGEALLKLLDDQHVDVQLQLAYTFGEWRDQRAATALAVLAVRHSNDPYLSAAVLSSIDESNASEVLHHVLASDSPRESLLRQLMSTIAAVGDQQMLTKAVTQICTPRSKEFATWQLAAVASTLQQLRKQGTATQAILAEEGKNALNALLEDARILAVDNTVELPKRAAAVQLLAESGEPDRDLELLANLLTPQQAIEMQRSAVEALAQSSDNRATEILLEGWDTYSPLVRAQVLDALINRQAWAIVLLDRIESGVISANQIDATRRQRLVDSNNDQVKDRARKLLAADIGSRQDAVERYQSVLRMPSDREHGRDVFLKRCSACHALKGSGHAVGADLAALGNKTPAAMLVAILDPNRAVEDKFVNYIAALEDGRQVSGVLASESGESLTLRGQEGKDQVILRSELEALKNTGKSLMPEGMEKDMSEQDLADVIAYLTSAASQ